jgi:spermidine synthase
VTRTWFEETLYPNYGQRFLVTRTLYKQKTEFQELAIHETEAFGRILTLDGICQTTEKDEFFYHEMMTHLPILAHGQARKVLIIGGGDGGILREALQHKTVEKATMVEIDPAVIELTKQYIPSIPGQAFEDPRTDLIIGDGVKFVAETNERYDVVIVDSTDPIGPAEVLFQTDFYAQCKRCLTERGVMVTQNGVPFMQRDEFTTTYKRLHPLFPDAGFYFVPVPTYIGGFMSLAWATLDSANRTQSREAIAQRFATQKLVTQYYTPDIHVAAFAMPAYLQKLVDQAK